MLVIDEISMVRADLLDAVEAGLAPTVGRISPMLASMVRSGAAGGESTTLRPGRMRVAAASGSSRWARSSCMPTSLNSGSPSFT